MINKSEATFNLNEIFRKRRNFAKDKANYNLEVCFQNENFKNSFNAVRSLQFDLAKAEENSETAKEVEKKIELERKTLNAELTKCGFTKEQLKPQYNCKKCNDLGFVNGKECDCYKLEKNKIYLAECGINKQTLPSFKTANFTVFENETEIKKLYELAQSYILKFNESKKQNFIICGKTGVGKTYLTECMLNEAVNNNIFSIYLTAFNLNQTFLEYHLAKLNDKNKILDPLLTCDLLVIDDLGSENKMKNVTIEYLYLVLDTRLRNNLKTIITTNLTPEQVQDVYEDRVFSRIFNKQVSVVINMTGNDLRFKK